MQNSISESILLLSQGGNLKKNPNFVHGILDWGYLDSIIYMDFKSSNVINLIFSIEKE